MVVMHGRVFRTHKVAVMQAMFVLKSFQGLKKRIRIDTLKEVVQPFGRKQVVMGSLMKQRFSKAKLKVAYDPNGQQGHPPLVYP